MTNNGQPMQPDLCDPHIRLQYFGGKSAADVARLYPLPQLTLPLTADLPSRPPLPMCIYNFVTNTPGMDTPPAAKPRRKVTGSEVESAGLGAYFHAIVRAALYINGTSISSTISTGGTETIQFIPGYNFADASYGPRAGNKFMIVGKMWGFEEAGSGVPLSDRASSVLWDAWSELDLPSRKSLKVYATNLLKFLPPKYLLKSIPREWINDGKYLLWLELLINRPEWMLVLGAEPLKALIGTRAKITEYKGRVGELNVGLPDGGFVTKFIVLDDLYSIFRDPGAYRSLKNTLSLFWNHAAQDLGHTVAVVKSIPVDYKPVFTDEQLIAAVDESVEATKGGGYIAFDCEWEGYHPANKGSYTYTVQWSHKPGHARVLFVKRCGGAANTELSPNVVMSQLGRLLVDANARGAKLVGHFAKSDLPWLHSIGVDLYDAYSPAYDELSPTGELIPGYKLQKTRGAHDTLVAAHAIDEEAELKLEILCNSIFGVERWDTPVLEWKIEFAANKGIKPSQIAGYGNMPERMVTQYGGADADYAGRLFLYQNGDADKDGALDADRFGNNCRRIFWYRMSAVPAWAEMEKCGLRVDRQRHAQYVEEFSKAKVDAECELRKITAWYDLSLRKPSHKVELLFGETFSRGGVPVRPAGAVSLYLQPYKSTKATKGKLWSEAVRFCEESELPPPKPAADGETLTALRASSPNNQVLELIAKISVLDTALKGLLRPPDAVHDDGDDGDDDPHYEKGMLKYVSGDGKIRSIFGYAETGRATSSKYNLQNIGATIDEKYNAALGRKG